MSTAKVVKILKQLDADRWKQRGVEALTHDASGIVEYLESRGFGREDLEATYGGPKGDTAFLLGVLFDGLVRAQYAWAAPVLLAEDLGSLIPSKLASLSPKRLSTKLKAARCGGKYPGQMAGRIIESFKIVVAKYGRPAGMWNGALTYGEVIARFTELSGVGQKRARMATNLLSRGWGIAPVKLSHEHELDIPVDVMVARVFVRSGLVRYPKAAPPGVSKLVKDITVAARIWCPDRPVTLDSAFAIGNAYCGPTAPDCEHCPLGAVRACRLSRTAWTVLDANS